MNTSQFRQLQYPPVRRVDQVDDYHGTLVEDPYRWLEDLESGDTHDFIAAQNAVTEQVLSDLAPVRERLQSRLTELWNYARRGTPRRYGRRWFYSHNTGLQNQAVLFTATRLNDEKAASVLIDPNTLAADGTVALKSYQVSPSGELVAYGVSSSGSDWETWRVRNVETGEDLPDELNWVKFSGIAWSKDNSGFFYSRMDTPAPGQERKAKNLNQKLYYHTLGTPQSEDRLIYARPDQPEWFLQGYLTEDGRYLIIGVYHGASQRNRLFYKDLSNDDNPVVELFADGDARYAFVGNQGPTFWIHTDLNAPMSRLVSVNVNKSTGGKPELTEIIAESKDKLEGVSVLDGKFLTVYLEDVHSAVRTYTLQGRLVQEIELPGIGTVGGFAGKQKSRSTFYIYTSFAQPATVYRLDVRTGKSTVYFQPELKFDPSDYVTEQHFYPSQDGTLIPMFITYKKGFKRDGTGRVYQYGYGSHGNSQTPTFSTGLLAAMELGFAFSLCNIRGGGEYGAPWREAAARTRKYVSVDDFAYGTMFLYENKWCGPEGICIGGGSSGGLLVGSSIIRYRHLYKDGCACIHVGTLDMVRFNQFTAGVGWTAFYGSPQDPAEFAALFALSPYHNCQPGEYPTTLLLAAEHDDRVVPSHSYKFISALQRAQQGPNPCLIRIETKVGHGLGKPTAKLIAETADKWAIVCQALKMNV